MKNKLTKEEQLIEFLNRKFENSNTNEVSINRHELPDLNLTEKKHLVLYIFYKKKNYLLLSKNLYMMISVDIG